METYRDIEAHNKTVMVYQEVIEDALPATVVSQVSNLKRQLHQDIMQYNNVKQHDSKC